MVGRAERGRRVTTSAVIDGVFPAKCTPRYIDASKTLYRVNGGTVGFGEDCGSGCHSVVEGNGQRRVVVEIALYTKKTENICKGAEKTSKTCVWWSSSVGIYRRYYRLQNLVHIPGGSQGVHECSTRKPR